MSPQTPARPQEALQRLRGPREARPRAGKQPPRTPGAVPSPLTCGTARGNHSADGRSPRGGLRREAGEQGAGPPPREPRATAEPAGPDEWDAAAAPAELAVGCAHAPPRPGHVTQAPPPPPDARRGPRAPPGDSGSPLALSSEEAFEKFLLVPMATLRRCAGFQSPAAKECNMVRFMKVWKRYAHVTRVHVDLIIAEPVSLPISPPGSVIRPPI